MKRGMTKFKHACKIKQILYQCFIADLHLRIVEF